MKIEITVPQAVVDDFKSSEEFIYQEGDTDAKFIKRIIVNMFKKKYGDVRATVIWKETKEFIRGNQDGIK